MLEIKFENELSLSLGGRLDVTQVAYAEKEFAKLHSTSVVDMAQLVYISSAGLGVLLSTLKRLKVTGHTLRLRNLSPPIRNLFHISGFDRVFDLE